MVWDEIMADVLITGGTGFIGANLAIELRNRGHSVLISDVQNYRDDKSIRCDVSKFRQVEQLFDNQNFDYVYHAAAEYGRWNGEAYYENLWLTNVVGTRNLLEMQRKKRFKLLYFGSAEVYGDYNDVMSEDVMEKVPIRQMNDYAITKWVNELQIMNFEDMYSTETVRFRLFNVYGPREHYTSYRGVIPVFIYKALHKQPYTVYKGHKRTFEYVEDICRTLGNMIDNFKPGEIYNLGSEEQYSIERVSKIILEELDMDDSLVTYKEGEAFTTLDKIADSSKAKTDLNHKITVSLEDGIAKTVSWFRDQYMSD
jgi:dTDP-glucose 4,6-dehydratase